MDSEEVVVVQHHEGHDDNVAVTVTAGVSRGLDMDDLFLDRLRFGTVTRGTSTVVSVDTSPGRSAVFTGAFVYASLRNDPPALPISGQVERVQEFENGALVVDAQGATADAARLFGFLKAGDMAATRDILFGSSDKLIGSAFPDRMAGYAGADSIDGGGGSDTLDGGDGADTVAGGVGDDAIRGLAGDDSIDGGAGDDDVNGNTGADIVLGGEGADIVRGGQGNDLISGGAGDDPHVNGNLGDDQVFGGDGRDTLFGGQGLDALYGEAGDDQLSGDLGDDTLTGGPGADRFVLRVGGGLDRVTDFSSAEGDRVLLAPGAAYTVAAQGGDVVVDLGGGDRLTLTGVTMATLGDWLVTG